MHKMKKKLKNIINEIIFKIKQQYIEYIRIKHAKL